MRFFFFGTLMDIDVLSEVIGRKVPAELLKPAHLSGFRRVAVEGASYPIIVEDEDGVVEGVMMAGISPEERALLEAYEGKGYRVTDARVDARAQRREVLMFEPVEGAHSVKGKDWDLAHWQRHDKAHFLEGVRRWKSAERATTQKD
jgi:hypothetical protein